MVPIESLSAFFYMTSVESNTKSLTVWPQITRMTNQPPTQPKTATACVAVGPVCNTYSLDLIIQTFVSCRKFIFLEVVAAQVIVTSPLLVEHWKEHLAVRSFLGKTFGGLRLICSHKRK